MAVVDDLDFSTETGKRAVYERFEFHPRAGVIEVANASHEDPDEHSYDVVVRDGEPVSCTCPAFEYHCGPNEACKHMTACALAEAVLDAAAAGGSD